MDRQFISYPKSGRSWVRYILHLLGMENRIYFHHDGCEFSDSTRPPLALDFAARLTTYSRGARVVYLRRDPRDVMVSLYFQIKGRMRDVFDFKEDISAFIRDDYFGASNLFEFDRQWRGLCRRGLALCVSYEECHENLGEVIGRILTWYELEASDQEVRAACEAASLPKMRAVELSGTFSESWLRPRSGATKIRCGVVGGYADVLSEADVAFLEQFFRAADSEL